MAEEFTANQKNIFIGICVDCVNALDKLNLKISTRLQQFINENGNSTGPIPQDNTKLSIIELKTKLSCISKIHAEIINVESALIFEMQRIDKEIMKR